MRVRYPRLRISIRIYQCDPRRTICQLETVKKCQKNENSDIPPKNRQDPLEYLTDCILSTRQGLHAKRISANVNS